VWTYFLTRGPIDSPDTPALSWAKHAWVGFRLEQNWPCHVSRPFTAGRFTPGHIIMKQKNARIPSRKASQNFSMARFGSKFNFRKSIFTLNGRIPNHKASQNFSMARFGSKFNFRKSIFTLLWNRKWDPRGGPGENEPFQDRGLEPAGRYNGRGKPLFRRRGSWNVNISRRLRPQGPGGLLCSMPRVAPAGIAKRNQFWITAARNPICSVQFGPTPTFRTFGWLFREKIKILMVSGHMCIYKSMAASINRCTGIYK